MKPFDGWGLINDCVCYRFREIARQIRWAVLTCDDRVVLEAMCLTHDFMNDYVDLISDRLLDTLQALLDLATDVYEGLTCEPTP